MSHPVCYALVDPRRHRVRRAAIGCVEHDAPVLSGTLRDNLLLGNTNADDNALREEHGTPSAAKQRRHDRAATRPGSSWARR
ncbi:hypothetical protein [Streptomyces sp. NPDC018833]|uniref:hypothetical protein n=1 Tax=Streptomyces sp. NPDC018833 TaxID=3365053 RepID=UPI0037A4E389